MTLSQAASKQSLASRALRSQPNVIRAPARATCYRQNAIYLTGSTGRTESGSLTSSSQPNASVSRRSALLSLVGTSIVLARPSAVGAVEEVKLPKGACLRAWFLTQRCHLLPHPNDRRTRRSCCTAEPSRSRTLLSFAEYRQLVKRLSEGLSESIETEASGASEAEVRAPPSWGGAPLEGTGCMHAEVAQYRLEGPQGVHDYLSVAAYRPVHWHCMTAGAWGPEWGLEHLYTSPCARLRPCLACRHAAFTTGLIAYLLPARCPACRLLR